MLPAGPVPEPLALNLASCAHLPLGPGSNLHLFAGKKGQLWPLPTGDFSDPESFLNSVQQELGKLNLTRGFRLLPSARDQGIRERVPLVDALEPRGPRCRCPDAETY